MTDPTIIEGYKKLAGAMVIEAVKDALRISVQGKPKLLVITADDWFETEQFEFCLCALPTVSPEAVKKLVNKYKYLNPNKRQAVKYRLTAPMVKKQQLEPYPSANMTVHSGILRVAEPG